MMTTAPIFVPRSARQWALVNLVALHIKANATVTQVRVMR